MAQVHVELGRRAERDLRRLEPPDHRRIVRALTQTLAREPLPKNADDRPLAGAPPWRRLRVGEFRILYRALASEELPAKIRRGRRVARIVDRRDLERAISTLR